MSKTELVITIMIMWTTLMIVVAAASTDAVAIPQTDRSNCQTKCGNVNIPYPFGTSDGCYLKSDRDDNRFFINCTWDHKPFLVNTVRTKLQVLDISIDGQLRVLTKVLKNCSSTSTSTTSTHHKTTSSWNKENDDDDEYNDYTNSPFFPFSNIRNKLFGVGCSAYMSVDGLDGNYAFFRAGCFSKCSDLESLSYKVTNLSSCSGKACCKISLQQSVPAYKMSVFLSPKEVNYTDVDGRPFVTSNCSYSLVMEEGSSAGFNFSKFPLNGGGGGGGEDDHNEAGFTVPTVLEWAIPGRQYCAEEKSMNKMHYACKENSNCVDVSVDIASPGYRCECSKGYEGNPYVHNGCRDINECETNLNDCSYRCTNTIGSYTCHCPVGRKGDGRSNGSSKGCDIDLLFVMKIVAVIGASFILLVATSILVILRLKKRKQTYLEKLNFRLNGGILLKKLLSGQEGYPSADGTKIFKAKELEVATNNFDEDRIIGRGGCGTVYKGTLPDGRVVAIKKSKVIDRRQIDQFINEVVVLLHVSNRNVVKLLGCCLETESPLLVYEFISNGTLFDHIHAAAGCGLTWQMRLRIAAETAGVLAYLHSAACFPIIHRDVKSTNILLDDNYTAKVSDFGISRLIFPDQGQMTTLVQGTIGYLDPEYLQSGQLTEKSDVYSFGVVLVELLTGKKVLSFDKPDGDRYVVSYFLDALKEDKVLSVLDPCLVVSGNEDDIEQLKEAAKLAKRCLRVKREKRPTMKEVATELESNLVNNTMSSHSWAEDESSSKEASILCVLSDQTIHMADTQGHSINTGERALVLSPKMLSSLDQVWSIDRADTTTPHSMA
ncbi:Wall-associated receptor kinase [Parasponia andersonii]|uniref:Wall-associated receptor kinase n=1 Tax=Parasponia andersonii TaxID=3476 RepID=A0A2P5D3M7_PARAD|nr:Wall-associated receptor kinase [Parasponia andersonii]